MAGQVHRFPDTSIRDRPQRRITDAERGLLVSFPKTAEILSTARSYTLYMLIACCCLCVLAACKSHPNDAVFRKVSPSSSGIIFKNELTYSDSLSVLEFEYMFNGSGVALLDVNNDGLQDVMFGGNMVSSRLYLNKGNLRFEDITKKAGVETNGWILNNVLIS